MVTTRRRRARRMGGGCTLVAAFASWCGIPSTRPAGPREATRSPTHLHRSRPSPSAENSATASSPIFLSGSDSRCKLSLPLPSDPKIEDKNDGREAISRVVGGVDRAGNGRGAEVPHQTPVSFKRRRIGSVPSSLVRTRADHGLADQAGGGRLWEQGRGLLHLPRGDPAPHQHRRWQPTWTQRPRCCDRKRPILWY
jgi:hypothetical protein